MRRSGLPSLIGFVAVTLLAVAGVLAAGWKPLLGLDLQGGVSVVLKPKVATDSDKLGQAIAIIRSRVDALGVAEPEITRQGSNIVVSLPGVKDRQRALDLVGTTAELRFRPVLTQTLSPERMAELQKQAEKQGITTTTGAGTTDTSGANVVAGQPTTSTVVVTSGDSGNSSSTTTTATTAASSTTAKQSAFGSPGGSIGKGELAMGGQSFSDLAQDGSSTTAASSSAAPTTSAATATTAGTTDTTAGPGATTDTTTATSDSGSASLGSELTSRDNDKADQTVVLADYDDKGKELSRYILGPALATGDGVEDAQLALNGTTGEPYVQLTFKSGETGVDAWRAAAKECYQGTQRCPVQSGGHGRLAIVLDGKVLSAPTVQSDFHGVKTAQITGSFSRKDAKDLATALRYGALPVELERQQAQEVSATVGKDALRAGVVTGILGLAIVTVYILAYYRLLGLVAVLSLTFSFGLLWSIISWLGNSRGLALSLSGVVGIIVSIGVSIDSNIVYFEVIKDDMHSGRTLRSSAQRAFRSAMRTIIRADAVSLIGAGLLYFLTVGSVRGFAFYLGLATILDLVASYMFMRPAVSLLARSRLAQERPSLFGIPKPKNVGPAGVVLS